VLDPIVNAFDEPFADSSAIPIYYVGDGEAARHGGADRRRGDEALAATAMACHMLSNAVSGRSSSVRDCRL
jgi:hypothetical protein